MQRRGQHPGMLPPVPTEPATHRVELRNLASVVPYARNARAHSETQVMQLVASLREYGWTAPILVDTDGEVIAGHGRLMAAQRVHEHSWRIRAWPDTSVVPVIVIAGLTPEQLRAYRIADNRIAENSSWDKGLLELEVGDLDRAGMALDTLGFAADELSLLLGLETELDPPDDAAHDVIDGPTRYSVIVTCDDEPSQARTVEKLSSMGLECRAVTRG